MSSCAVIIKTHNSEKVLSKCILSLKNQTRTPDHILIVDSASNDDSYLKSFQNQAEVLIVREDIGFCQGNNLGYNNLSQPHTYVLFLNPDAFLTPKVVEELIKFMEQPENSKVGGVTGSLYGYDIDKDEPTGLVDSTGVFRNWLGNWYDRDQRSETVSLKYQVPEKVPAICGAFMFCRKKALDEVLIRGMEVFDSKFFMYKEDVDLSLRLRKRSWGLIFLPWISIYHCRGWNQDRKKVPRKNRLLSARNDIRIDCKQKSLYLCVSLFKYFFVKVVDY